MRAALRVSLLAAAIVSFAPAARAQFRPHSASPAPVPLSPAPLPSHVPAPASVMWIGAHPDDEAIAAPLLARWCLDGRARCSFLIATRGEKGPCLLPAGCLPDLASVRSAEAAAAAELFGADLILLSLPDGGGGEPPSWAPGTSRGADLAATLAAFIRAEAPEILLTFDPRHGTTCHPDHRAIAELTLETAALVAAPPAVYLLETRVETDTEAIAFHFAPAAPGTIRYDANERLVSTAGPAWSAIEWDMERHPSQFDAGWRAAVSRVPESDRAVFLAPAAEILRRTVSACP
ncbi:MAG TPA: PIG-L family deacetylase [Thermoanaerobaculia bacterium]